jgi:adenylyltransferase/sulfurtransferase
MDLIPIPPHLLRRCFDHGEATYPEEGCGVLSGPLQGDGLDEFHPVANILNPLHEEEPERYPRTAREGYVLDPAVMVRLEKELAAKGRKVKVIVHSHVDVGAYFSEEDKQRALWAGEPLLPGVVYLVCGVRDRRPDGAVLAYFDPAVRDFRTVEVLARPAGDASHPPAG